VVTADLTESGAPETVVASARAGFGGIDVLVNNAGNVRAGRLEAIEESEVMAQVALNLTAPILLTRAALPSLRESDHGLVINISSGIGLIAMPFYATYAATKAGIAHFGEALRRELYGEGVHVLTVYPGATSTPMMESSKAGAAEGFEYEPPESVADATVEAILDGSLTVVRGGQQRRDMIATNREDPSSVDRMLAERKPCWRRPSKHTPASADALRRAVALARADHVHRGLRSEPVRPAARRLPAPPALTDTQATAVFGVYALGLIPGLLIGGRASDRFGRRTLMIAFAALSPLATAVLAGGRWGLWLYAGRLLTGVVSGTVSPSAPPGSRSSPTVQTPGWGWGHVERASP
jgi:uncharacterized oxidoreductase